MKTARDSTDLVSRQSVYDVENWLSPSQAGRILGVSGQWVTMLCRNGKLRAARTSLGWLVDPDDLEWLRKQRIEELEAKVKKMKGIKHDRIVEDAVTRGRGNVTQAEARAAARAVRKDRS